MQDKRLLRVSTTQLALRDQRSIPVRIFANEQVPIESAAVDELVSVLEGDGQMEAVAVTPDFHKGAGIPIGTVIKTREIIFPQAIGNDINCGMRLHTTDLEADTMAPHLGEWETHARQLFFEGQRQIPMTGREREALLKGGLSGLMGESPWQRLGGQWQTIVRQGWDAQLDSVDALGSQPATTARPFADWIGKENAVSYDDQIGSIGGGNHFVEIQRVEEIFDRKTAFAWGLKKGAVAVMIHSGSVGIGHIAGRFISEILKASHPAGVARPRNGIYPLSLTGASVDEYWDVLNNAANFAFANRMFLAASAVESLERVVGELRARLLYDSPHNFVWKTTDGGYVHRKGSTPARGAEAMAGTPFHYYGEPVLVPGSMGASSFVLAGMGKAEALESASHGAGRALSRGEAGRSGQSEFAEFLRNFRVVTPLDMRLPDVRGRAEILKRKMEELRAEGPHAYKGIGAIIQTLEEAGIARKVAEMRPMATVKG